MQLKTTFLTLFAFTAWQHLVFSQNWNLANATVNQCAGTFFDPGGAGNYGNSQNITGTICPSTPGMCVALNFTSFNTEEGFDILRVYDSNSNSNCSNATAAWHGTDIPGYIVANNPSGCLTFNFTSDASVNNSGWQATISCVPCGTPSTTTFPPVDCFNSVTVCDDQQLNFNSNGEGFDDFTGSNISANGCLSGDEHQSAWFQVTIAANSPPNATLSFTLTPTAGGGEDYDFALYGPNTSCCNLGNPVRCSFAASACGYCPQTGMGNGATDFTENAAGDGFVAPLTVQPGQTYFLLIDNYLSSSQGFFLDWTGNAVLGCACNTVPVITGNATICPGQTTTLTATGDNLTNYLWSASGGGIISGGNNGASITAASVGTYTVSVTNAVGCTGFASVTVTQVPVPNINNTVNGATCGQSNGSINLTVSAGTPPYTFNWSNSATTEDLPNIPAGTYTVTVTGANGCTATASINVPNTNITLNVSGTTTNNTSCSAANGAVNISVSPAGTYTFNWSNSATTEDLSNVPNGSYTVTVTGGGSCTGTATFTVANNATPVTFDTEVVPATCGQSNGEAEVDDESGAGPFTYLWSNNSTNQEIEDLPAGTYTVTVTASNGCTATASVVVPNTNIVLNVTGTTTPNTSCIASNGAVNISVTPPGTYSFNWSNSTTTEDLSNVPNGSYTVTVTGSGSCTGTATFTVANNADAPGLNGISNPATCGQSNGSVNLSVSGGVLPYTFLWSNSATTEGLDDVPGGTYSVTVTGGNGCTASLNFTVFDNQTTVSVTGLTNPNTSCGVGTGNGSVSINVNPPATYFFNWSNGATTEDLSNVPDGTYTVTVTGSGSCSATASFTVANQPNNPTVSATTVASTCDLPNGDVNLTVSGGVTPYVFNWSNSATTQNLDNVLAGSYSVTVTGANGCSAVAPATLTNTNPPIAVTGTATATTLCTPGSGNGGITITVTPVIPIAIGTYTFVWSNGATSQNLTNLAPGSYTVTVSAGGTCSQTASFTVPDQPNLPVITLATVASTCDLPNGNVNLTVNGGVTPYVFNWSNSATTQNLDNVLAGSYSVTVTGANGCSAVASATLTNTNPPIAVTGTATANTLCTPGSGNGGITLTVTPVIPIAIGTYTFVWSNGATSQNLTNLAPGSYTVTVSAGGTCSQTASFTVPDQPNLPVITLATVASTCDLPNGNVNLTVNGGVTPYVFNWSNSATTQNLDNVLAGSYSVTVTGANGYSAVAPATLTNTNPPIAVTGTATANTLCTPGSGNGGISITVTPVIPIAIGTYTYVWSNAATSQNLTNLAPGSYSVTVSAGGSCSQTASFTVPDQPNLPVPTLATVASTCDLPNGDVNLTVSGGVTPYAFNWSNSATTQNLDNVLAGSYSVTVTGANGCSAVASATLTNANPPIVVTGTATANTLCAPGSGNGGIVITVTPVIPIAIGTYTYVWSNAATSQNLTNLAPGSYSVTVSAGGSCSQTASFTVPDQPNLPVPTLATVASTCDLPNGDVNLTVNGGVTPYVFNWSNSATTQNLDNVLAGSYSVTVTGANGCSAVAPATLTNTNPPIAVTGTATANTLCTPGSGNGGITLTVTPSGTYTYVWSNLATSQNLTNLAPGSYTVTVSAGGSCSQTASFTVPDQPNLPAITSSTTASTCNLPNGSASVSVSGSVPFTYNWSNSGSTSSIANVASGSYSVTVTGANGCPAVSSLTIPNNNVLLDISGVVTPNTTCAGGNGGIALTVVPGGVLTYNWSNSATTANLANLAPGSYSVTVSAGGTCTNSANFTVPDNSEVPSLSTAVTGTSCNLPNGAVDLSVSGGTLPYTYNWSNAQTVQDLLAIPSGNYSVTVTSAAGCTAVASANVPNTNPNFTVNGIATGNSSCTSPNGSVNVSVTPPGTYTYIWSNNATTNTILNLAAGTYTVTVSAGGSCTQAATFQVADIASLPNLATTTNPGTCGNLTGSVDLIVSNGTSPFSFAWSNSAVSQNLGNVGFGTYAVTVTDANGCTATTSASVGNTNFNISLNATPTPVTSCILNNGGVNLVVSPAVPNAGLSYAFAWSNAATTQNLSNLAAGSYTVTVTAGADCSAVATVVVPNNAAPPNLATSSDPAFCGLNNGEASVTATGGATPYAYLWSNGGTGNGISGVGAGTYTVTVSGSNGCPATASVSVPNNNIAINVTAAVTPLTSCSVSNGGLNISLTPASPPIGNYTFIWSNAAVTEDLPNLAAGNYSVTVSAGGSCTAAATFTVPNSTSAPVVVETVTPSICGLSNGAINLNVSGATTPYTFLWSNSQTTQNLASLPSGNYSVTVTAGNGCTSSLTVNVPSNSSSFALSGIEIPLTNCTANNGAVNLTVTPAGTYSFAWSNGATTEDIFVIPSGTYTVTVTQSGSCTATATFVVDNLTAFPSLSQVITAEVCGMTNGGIDLSVSGGATPYNYTWSNNATTQDLTAVAAGNYAVTVTSAGTGCSATGAFTVPANSVSFSLSGVTTVNTACSVSNGGVNLTVTPTGNYTFQWSNNATTEDLSGVPGGTYSVTVSAGGTCVNTANFTVGDATDSPSITENVTPTLCGQSNGGIDITASGSTTPYAYAWSNGYFTQDISGITAGNYFVTVTGANGCASVSGFLVPDTQISPLLTGTPTPNTSCNQNNGGVILVASPVIPYTYNWSNNATTQNLVNVPSGSYSVTVSAGGSCFSVASFNVPSTTADPVVSPTAIPAICGESNGGITLVVSGATTPYTFEWSNNATTQNLSNIPAGNYDVTVTGGNGCNAVSAVTVPDLPVIFSITGTPSANTLCTGGANGAVNLSASPSGNYNFLWSNNATTEDINSLAPATYTVTVTLGVNCTNTASFTVANNTNAPVFSQTVTPAACGNSAGGINLTVSGGTAPYAFNWSNSATTEDLANLPAGTYAVTVSGADGCANTGNFTVPDEVVPISVSGMASPNTSCAGGTGGVTTSVSPATGLNYTYQWSNNATTPNLSAVIGGNYSVTVSAGGGCSAVAAFTVPSTTNDPVLSQAVTPAVCGGSNGGINLTVSGSTTPYFFAWSNAATTEDLANVAAGSYSVTVTGGNGCQSVATVNLPDNPVIFSVTGTPSANTLCSGENGGIDLSVFPIAIGIGNYDFEWNTNASTEDLSGLAAGSYTVTVTLGVNCTNTAGFTVGNNTNAPVFSQTVTPAACGNSAGGINLTVSGGTAPYTFNWSNAATTEDLANLPSGTYAVTVTGADGCANTGNFTVPDEVVPITIAGTSSPNTSCAGGTGGVTTSVSPATGLNYTYSWSNNATTPNLSAVIGGNYSVTVSAGGGCSAVAAFTVPSTTNDPVLSQAVTPTVCGGSNGGINLTVSGSTTPYVFAWSNAATTEDLANVAAGSYSVTVTGGNGCQSVATVNLADNPVIFSVTGTPSANTLCTGENGAVNVSVSPADNYDLLWSNNATTEDLSGVAAGSYTVTVTLGVNCTSVAQFTVPNTPDLPAISPSVSASICGAPDGAIDLTVSGGTLPYDFNWSNSATTEDLLFIPSGSYAVTVTAANGCTATGAYNVANNSNTFSMSGVPTANTLCVGGNGGVNLTVVPAGNYGFTWTGGATTEDPSNLPPGTYTVTVNDGGSCTASATFTVADASPEVTVNGSPTHNLCFGDAAGAIDLSASGGIPPYNYAWTPAQTGNPQDPQNLTAGNYSVLVTDASGCTGTASFSIQQPLSGLSLDCSQSSSVSEPGANDGVGGVNISGGTAPYSVAWSPGGVQNNVGTGVFSINNLTEGSYLVAVEDANGCPAACDFLINAVECETQLGSMSNSLLALCGNGCITADYSAIGQFLDADDLLEFVLHEGSGNQIVNEIARNDQPVFCFDPALMNYGTTYYVSAVAGNDDGNGNVDLTDPCTVVSLSTPVIFEEQPVASAAPPDDLNCAVSEVGLSGSSDLPGSTFEWSTTGGGVLSGNANSPDVTAEAAGSYTLIVQTGNCADTVEVSVLDISNEVQALISASPNSLLDCTIHEIMLNGTVAGSANANIYWLYNDQTFSNQSSVPITAPGMYEFIALDTLTLCSDTAMIEIDEDQSYPPLFVNAPGLLTCANEVVVLSGGSPFPGIEFSWATISGNDTTIVGIGSSIEVGAPGEYFLLGIDPSNNCTNALPANVDADLTEPSADAGLPFTMDCFGEIAALDGSGSSGIGTLIFFWTSADGNLFGSSNVASPSIDEPGTYLLTVTQSGNGCSATDEVIIGSEAPVVSPSVIQPPCFGDEGTIVVEEILGGSPPFRYALDGGIFSGQNSFQNVAPGIYQVTVLDAEGCIGTAEAIVEQPDQFQIAVEANAVIELGDSYQIVTQVSIPESEIGQVNWTPVNGTLSCDTCLNPLATPLTTTIYHVDVVSKNGCRDEAALLLRVDKSGGVYVPNSFSPNGDGTNDVFMIFADTKSVSKVRRFLVLSRWGETVLEYYDFEPNNPSAGGGWDGTHRGEALNPAVFVWFAEMEMVDGRVVLFEGDVTLVR